MEFCKKQVKSDCDELLRRFQETESVRFHLFSEIWREMKFSHIYHGNMLHERRAFSRLILDTACSFFLPPFSFQIRVGGLYLLYSLYQCQTASPREKIRLALKDWEYVEKFEKDAVDAQHFDIVYILRQLMFHKAVHFTAMPSLLVFRKKRKVETSPLSEKFMERTSRPQELINLELLEELANIHERYEKMKTTATSTAERESSSINLIHGDFLPQLRSSVLDFYVWQQRKDGSEEADHSGEGTSSQQESCRRAELLAAIKSRAFGEAVEASKSRRHRQVKLESTSDTADPSHSSVYNKPAKLSLKARTERNICLTGDMWRDATTTTKISRLSAVDFLPEEKARKLKRFLWS